MAAGQFSAFPQCWLGQMKISAAAKDLLKGKAKELRSKR